MRFFPLYFNQIYKYDTKSKNYSYISKEFKYRFGYFFFCFCISALAAWIYQKEILYIYLFPLLQMSQNVIYTSISEGFSTILTLCFLYSVVMSFPFFIYQSVCFFLPSAFPEERYLIYKNSVFIIGLYILSILLSGFFLIPQLCSWFLNYSISTDFLTLSLQAKVSTYVIWSGKIYIFCICFLEVPLLFFLCLHKTTKIKIFLFLSKNRKCTLIFILLFCATISPPDIYTQIFIFFLLFLLFEFIFWCAFLEETVEFQKKK